MIAYTKNKIVVVSFVKQKQVIDMSLSAMVEKLYTV